LSHKTRYGVSSSSFLNQQGRGRRNGGGVGRTATELRVAAAHAAGTTTAISAASATTKITPMVAGRVWPALQRIASMFHPEQVMTVMRGVHLHLHPQDWAFVAVLAFVGYFRYFEPPQRRAPRSETASDSSELNSSGSQRSSVLTSLLQRVAVIRAVQELAQVALASYVVDILCLMLRLQHVHFPHLWDVPRVFAKTSFSLWALRQFLHQKRSFLQQKLGRGRSTLSSATIDLVDKSVNVICVGFMALLISDWISVELGLAFKGAVTLGGVGTLAFTLASKDLAAQLVSGIFLQAGNKMKSGEKVALGGSTGKVVKIGLTETVLRASDNTVRSSTRARSVGALYMPKRRSHTLSTFTAHVDSERQGVAGQGDQLLEGARVAGDAEAAVPLGGRGRAPPRVGIDPRRNQTQLSQDHFGRNTALPGVLYRLRRERPRGDGRHALCHQPDQVSVLCGWGAGKR
jgi:Mechanosensitive ion channel